MRIPAIAALLALVSAASQAGDYPPACRDFTSFPRGDFAQPVRPPCLDYLVDRVSIETCQGSLPDRGSSLPRVLKEREHCDRRYIQRSSQAIQLRAKPNGVLTRAAAVFEQGGAKCLTEISTIPKPVNGLHL